MKKQISNWTVEAFVFSGRQNPQWILNEKQANDWMNLWEAAPASVKDVQQPSRLGYTGCKLQFNEHSHWFVYDGCVSFYDKGQLISKVDAERKLEYFLLNTASPEIKEILRSMKVI